MGQNRSEVRERGKNNEGTNVDTPKHSANDTTSQRRVKRIRVRWADTAGEFAERRRVITGGGPQHSPWCDVSPNAGANRGTEDDHEKTQ